MREQSSASIFDPVAGESLADAWLLVGQAYAEFGVAIQAVNKLSAGVANGELDADAFAEVTSEVVAYLHAVADNLTQEARAVNAFVLAEAGCPDQLHRSTGVAHS